MRKLDLLLILVLVIAAIVFTSSAGANEIATVKKAVAKLMPNKTPDSITASAIPGLYEVVIGTRILYISQNGRYLVEGDVYDLKQQKNLTESKRSAGRMRAMKAIDKQTKIIFSPKKKKYTVEVFTDIDCGYCRKFHREINTYLDKGIEIRYLSFPRSGINTPSYYKAVDVWCAKDRKKAMTMAKSGGKVAKNRCKNNPIKQHLETGKAIGVSGTPTLVFSNGKVIPGYVPADRLSSMLEANKN